EDDAGVKHLEPIHGWNWSKGAWERFQRGVMAVVAIAEARERGQPVSRDVRQIVDEHLRQHLRLRTPVEVDPTDLSPGLWPYFVDRADGHSLHAQHSDANLGRFDSPDVLMAYVMASMFDSNVIPLGGGRCPQCGKPTGVTPKGTPRTGQCST